jgi:uncharacterized membrane protein YbhN (UPF0104 family)
MSLKTIKFRTVFFVLGAGALCIMVYHIGLDTIAENIRTTGWWFAAIIGIWLAVYLLNACSWRVILRDEHTPHVSFWNILKPTISGYAINYVTPVVALGGEPYRILEMRRHVGGKKATSSVLLYSMMHIMSHFLFWLSAAALTVVWLRPSRVVNVTLGVVVILCVAGIVFFLKAYRKGLLMKTVRIAGKIPYIKKRIQNIDAGRLAKIEETDRQIAHLYTCRRGDFYKSLTLEYLSRIVACLEVYFIVLALGMDFTFLDAVIIIAVTSLVANIMFFAPLQLGTREGGFLLAFQGISMSSGLGIYVSLITRIRETFWIMIGLILMRLK